MTGHGGRSILWRAPSALILALAVLPAQAAFGLYTSGSQSVYTSTAAPEAIELADFLASPTYPNWYWSVSDVWKTTDVFAACSGLSGSALSDCQQVQRARLWAFKLDPTTHAIVSVRSFALSVPAWALDPYLAQNNDWEDMTLGPVRTAADGTAAANLIIGATGNAVNNPVRDASGQDITCDTRRLIELAEPNLDDPADQVWTPWKIYDVKSYVGLGGATTCNSESLMQAPDAAGVPQAYMVNRAGRQVFSRSLDVDTGRDPGTPRIAAGLGLPYEPSVTYVGRVAGSTGAQFSAADANGTDIALLSPASARKPCQVYRWTMTDQPLATIITTVIPSKDAITCNRTEALGYARDPSDASVSTRDLYTAMDSKTTLRYWFLPWS